MAIIELGSVQISRDHKGGEGGVTKISRNLAEGGGGGGLSIFSHTINVQIPGYFMAYFEF